MEGTETEKFGLVGKQRETFQMNGKIFNRDRCCIIKTRKRISGRRIAQFYEPEAGKQQDSADQDRGPHVSPFIFKRKRFPFLARIFGFTV